MRSKIVGVIGSGLIGNDPFDERAWSGSSKFFFKTCEKYNILARAFGAEVPSYYRYPIMLRNFSFNKQVWQQKFYLDTMYYDLLTKELARKFIDEDFESDILQIGGIYKIPEVVDNRTKCYSYHDGNLAQLVKSPYMPKGIPDNKINNALEYEKAVYKSLDKIFTMSHYLKESFIHDFGITENKVINIGAGINIDKIPDKIIKDYRKKEVLFIGIDFYRKGGEFLLKAFSDVRKRYNNARLHIIGPRKLDIAPEYKSGIMYHGFLSRKDANQNKMFEEIIRDCSLFVMPSIYEPFGIAPLEAMINQIPCILTNRWAFPEMVKPGINGELVNCEEVDELSDKMLKMLSEPDKLEIMGRTSREIVLENYTWNKVIEKFISNL